MPNYCSNNITIAGKPEDVKELYDRIHVFLSSEGNEGYWGGTYYTMFRTMHPYYKKGDNSDENKEFDVYREYGSKWWDPQDYDIEDDHTSMRINGDSAWSPVLQLCEKLALEYNLEITCEFCEPGMNFAGEVTFDSTGCIHEKEYTCEEYEYLQDKDYFYEDITGRADCFDNYAEFEETFSETYKLLIDKYSDHEMVDKIKKNVKEWYESADTPA
jgi:hypothetical protein